MHKFATVEPATPVEYPDSDGQPMADNSVQFRWISTIAGNLAGLFRSDPNVLVGGDMLWYAEENNADECVAPDVFVVLGRPKGDRGSYKQWEEDGVPMTVVFEILSPGNKVIEMIQKFSFYAEHGVEEYFIFDPDIKALVAYKRGRATLVMQKQAHGYVSPRLGIRFDLSGDDLIIYRPDGRPFLTFEQLEDERERMMLHAEQAEQGRKEAEQGRKEAEQGRKEAEQGRKEAEQGRKDAEQRAGRLADLVRKVLQHQATAEEQAELQRLLQAGVP